MMKGRRRKFTGTEKVSILRTHLVEHVPVSKLCEDLGLQPTQFYSWQKQFFENGASAFERLGKSKEDESAKKVAALEAKVQRKNEVLSELMEEHVALKKELGEL